MNGKRLSTILFVVIFVLGAGNASVAEQDYLGKPLPQFELEKPESVKVQKYLGLESMKPFRLTDIPAKLVVIEVMSVLCQVCQQNAPQANQLYQFLLRDPELKKDVKMLGIGVGDDWEGLAMFRKLFRTAFPLFPDEESNVFELLGEPKTPLFLITNKQGKIVYSHSGLMESKEVLSEIKKLLKEM